MSSANAPSKKSHPFNISGVVEVSEILPPLNDLSYTWRNSTVSITCNGLDDANEREYDGILTGYSATEHEVEDEHCYTIKGRMIPSSECADFQIYFDPIHKIDSGPLDTFVGRLHDNTAASGFGIVGAKTEVPDLNSDSAILVFVMKHTDYRPEDKSTHEFEVEYRMRPTPNLKKTQALIQEGKETLVHGYIVDWSEAHNRWVVDASVHHLSSINIASGHQSVTKKKATTSSQVTATGRVKPAKHNSTPTKPAQVTPKKRAAPAAKSKARAAAPAAANDGFDEGFEEADQPEEPVVPPVKKRAPTAAKGKARAAAVCEPEEELEDGMFEAEFDDAFEPPTQGTSTGRGTKAGRVPRRPRGAHFCRFYFHSWPKSDWLGRLGRYLFVPIAIEFHRANFSPTRMASLYPAASIGPAARTRSDLAELSLAARFPGEMPLDIGDCDDPCVACGALHWRAERTQDDWKAEHASYSSCCQKRAVALPSNGLENKLAPQFVQDLLTGSDSDSKHFRKHIRAYNNSLSFTSNGVETDKSVAGNGGTWTYRIFGQLSHNIGALLPPEGAPRKFAQIFMGGDQAEGEAAARSKAAGGGLRPAILKRFQRFLYAKNPFAKLYKSAEEVANGTELKTIKIKSLAVVCGIQ
ncbi:uncharacterized protein MELLADRAFT_62854 [Melampsora larici-populina 98AG31]|uniref:Uncharacterized protein n=1 Tax=Melampsora larici-populina (strain 98AG31 / pathotype 3-4-7) TaxID=747676 RepID=F4RKI0_MELLP|nr:uncharacterized protein MELLADRAFT_62854 [Melampsora larici-populina 98AG31]EGG07177.1 hypothetical protein MELLADRAFT_62854 [Melampsora larici-populina 98AG31]